jgi:Zn-dependent M28 family amino/carboxypeptidase
MNEVPLNKLSERLRRHVETLARTPRPPTTPAHREAANYLRDHLEVSGFVVEESRFSIEADDPLPCCNLLTRPWPEDATLPLFILAAHYDSIPDSPGADDNASAVAALLEVARWLRPQLHGPGPWRTRLQLAAYDLEEYGLIGSQVHCIQLKKAGAPVRGMISLEMLGYTDSRPGSQQLPPFLVGMYPDVGNFIGAVGNDRSRELLGVAVAGLKSVPGLPVEFMAVPGNGEMLPQTRLSDHSSFWDRDYPALMITDTSFFRNPHYHQASDTPETLDYPFLARVTLGVGAAVWQLLQGERPA